MTLSLATLLFTIILNILLGLVVFLRSPKKASSIFFSLIVLSSSIWMAANYLVQVEELTIATNRIANQAAYLFAIVSFLFIYLFSANFYQIKAKYSKSRRLVLVLSLLILPLAPTQLIAGSVERINNEFQFSSGSLLPVYSIILLLVLAITTVNFISVARDEETNNKTRVQARIMALGFLISAMGGILLSTVVPYLTGDFTTARLGPLFVVFFIGFTSYAIIRHKLFDIKLVVARSIGYFLSVLSVALLFAFSAFLVVNFLTDDEVKIATSQQALYTLVAVGLAFVFQPVKRFFDKLSNSIFYRDAYDPQEFLDELNKVLVSRVDVEPLLLGSVEAIKKHIKSNFVTFYLRETQYIDKRYLGDNDQNFEEDDIEKISIYVSQIHRTLIVADELEDDNSKLKDLLQKYDIAVIARLVTTVDYDVAGVGFLMLGPKRSGSPYSRGDVKVLEIVANELVIAVQNALRFEEIEEFNVTLQKKVDEATKKLRATNKKLEEMDETKDEFISMASHQLRTPLTSVKGYLSMVLEGDAGEIKPMQERLLSQAFTSSQRMVYLIADLLNVSRLRTGRFVIEKIRANLADIAEGEVAQLKETAASRSLELEFTKPDNIPDLMLDETKMRQVIMNFIDNAIYYTPSGGKITVEIVDKDDAVELTVTDTGMGVPKVDQQHMFTKFYRAGNARKARPDGTGLGLFMAKKVIIEQGGAIIFKSKEGEGSTFGFTLPKKKLLPENNQPKSENKS